MRRLGRRQLFALGGGAVLGAGLTGVVPAADPAASSGANDEIDNPKRGGQQVVWSVATERPAAALTFDDGPHHVLTPRVLAVLDRYDVPASFFMMGHCADTHPELVAEVVAAGHEVGNHSWRHLNLADASASETRTEIEVGARKIEAAAGVPVTMFRPPRGRLNEAALRVLAPLRHDVVLWSVTRGALDWRSPAKVAANVVSKTGPGDIVDLHDGIGRWTFDPRTPRAAELLDRRLVELEALPRIIEGIREKGLDLVRVSDLLSSPPALKNQAR